MLRKLLANRLARDTAVLFGVQIVGYILPLILLPYLARVLGPSNFGLLGLGTALILYFGVIVEYGFAVIGTRKVAIAQGDNEEISRIYVTIMTCRLTLLALCFVGLIVTIFLLPGIRKHWDLYLISFLQVVGLALSPNWLFQGLQHMKWIAYSDYGAKLLSLFLTFIIVRQSEEYLYAAALQASGFLISALIGLFLVYRNVPLRLHRPDRARLRAALIEGWPVFLSMAGMIFTTSTNTMILGAVGTTADVGYLNGAQRLIIAARALTNPITGAIYPHMSRLASHSPAEGVRFLLRQVFWTAAPFLLLSIGMLFLSPLASRLLYGERFAETGVLLQIMSLTPFVHAVSMCFGTYYMLAYGFEREWARIIQWTLLLNFICIFLLMQWTTPVRAVAITITTLDVVSATACFLFYRRTVASVMIRT